MTLGSDKSKQLQREQELAESITHLKFNNLVFENIKETEVHRAIEEINPKIIICPHLNDNHKTHIKTSKTIHKILKNTLYSGFLIENEYWSQILEPNLFVEFDKMTVLTAMEAISKHRGEIKRNPYHLTFPSWLIDTTRRASEMINGHKNTNQAFFGQLYNLSEFDGGNKKPIKDKHFIKVDDDLFDLLN